MATGSGIVDRSLLERLGVLLGDRGPSSKDQVAVRRGELTSMVIEIIEAREKKQSESAAALASADDEDDTARIPTFHADPVNGVYPADFYSWGLSTFWKPPVGNGGGAAYLPRNSLTGLWLASASWGGRGNNLPRLFLKNGSGVSDDFGVWREVYHEANIVGPCQIGPENIPIGSVIESNVGEANPPNGRYLRLADGTQICRFGPTVSSLPIGTSYYGGFRCPYQTWTFPVPFAATPQVFPHCTDAFGATKGAVSLVDAQFAATAVTSQTAASRSFDLLAVGRWL